MIDRRQTHHPLRRQGTQQSERLLQALIPGNLRLDDRSMADLLAFAGEFAKHVRYWGADNTPGGDWSAFWEKDTTPLLALIASTDLEDIRARYCNRELEYYRLKQKEEQEPSTGQAEGTTTQQAIAALVLCIKETAEHIPELCAKLPAGNPIKAEIGRMVKSTLRHPLNLLIAYHKGIVDKTLNDQYRKFLNKDSCAAMWGMTENDFNAIDYWNKEYDPPALWQLFLVFYKALVNIVSLAKDAFQKSLQGRNDHQPHIALFLAFLHLFRYLQDEINSFTAKHLLFYYQEVLRLQERREIPDRVHLVFELAQNVESHLLSKGVQFLGGKDARGLARYYALEDELVVSRARLVEKKNLYFREEPAGERTISVMLPGADMKDGVDIPFAENLKLWHPLSGMSLFDRLNYKRDQIQKLKPQIGAIPDFLQKAESEIDAQLNKIKASTGFTVSTPELVMEKASSRFIFLSFNFEGECFDILNFFNVEISTKEGVLPITTADNNLDLPLSPSGDQPFKKHTGQAYRNNQITFHEDFSGFCVPTTTDIVIILNEDCPAIPLGENGALPFLRFTLKDNKVSQPKINSITIYTAVNILEPCNTHGVTVHLDGRNYIGNQPIVIPPNSVAKELVIKFDELFLKNINYLDVVAPNHDGSPELMKCGQFIALPSSCSSNLNEDTEVSIPDSYTINSQEDGWIKVKVSNFQQNPPRVFYTSDVRIRYVSSGVSIPINTNEDRGRNPNLPKIQYFTSFGEWTAVPGSDQSFYAVPHIEQPVISRTLTASNLLQHPTVQPANGNLFLGFEAITPGQQLSLLIYTAEGTGNPDKIAPEIVWSYLRDNNWVQFPPQFILKDETNGLQKTGIFRLLIPTDINQGNTWIKGKKGRTDLYWIRASATEDPENNISVEALPMLRDIFVQAGAAVFQNNGNSQEHLETGLPSGTISQLRFREVKVRSITQPFPSFDGRLSEEGDRLGYYRRIHERLRHRQRAVNVYDYERLVLEAFPKIALVKCLPHSAYSRYDSVAAPGRVQIAVLPNPEKMVGARKYYPSVDAGDLTDIQNFLNKHNSMFVSGSGGAHFCCCDNDEPNHTCKCRHCNDRLQVINARMEPLRLHLCVRFKAGKDIPYYTQKLNEAIKDFLAPWATSKSSPLIFGASVSMTRLLQFVEMLEYIDVVMDLKFKHFYDRKQSELYEAEVPWQQGDRIEPFTSRSVLTTYLDVLNDENPNVVDHDIHVIDDQDACKCINCVVEEVRRYIQVEMRKSPSANVEQILQAKATTAFFNFLVKTRKLTKTPELLCHNNSFKGIKLHVGDNEVVLNF